MAIEQTESGGKLQAVDVHARTTSGEYEFWAVNTSGVPFSNLLVAPWPLYAPANVLNKTSFTKLSKGMLLMRCERSPQRVIGN